MSVNLHLRYGDYEATTTLLSTIESQEITCGKRTETEDPTRMAWENILKSLEHEREIQGEYEDPWTGRPLRAEPRLPIRGLFIQVAALCHISLDHVVFEIEESIKRRAHAPTIIDMYIAQGH